MSDLIENLKRVSARAYANEMEVGDVNHIDEAINEITRLRSERDALQEKGNE